MLLIAYLLIGLLVALTTSAIFTPLVGRIAWRVGLVDRPDSERKLHGQGTALGGGIAILGAWLFALGLLAAVPPEYASPLGVINRQPARLLSWPNLGVIIAACVIAAVGLLDDRYRLRGRQKLVGQLIAVGLVLSCGLVIERIGILGWRIELGVLAVPFTVFWLLGAVNALNLLDGADGMAGTVSAVICVGFAGLATLTGNMVEAMIAMTLAGAIGGFLIYNWPPAKIFLGDAGSMLIGLVIGVLAIRTSLKSAATLAMVAPVAMLTIPIFDSFIAVLRRRLTGRSIYSADRAHLHHCLLRAGLPHRVMLVLVGGMCFAVTAATLVSTWLKNELIALIASVTMVSVLVASGLFGRAELYMLSQRLVRVAGSLLPRRRCRSVTHQSVVRLQGTRNWEQVWAALTDFAERYKLQLVRLDVSAAWLHEGYHAVWEAPGLVEDDALWHTRIPVFTDCRQIGRLEVAGPAQTHSLYTVFSAMAELLDTLHLSMRSIADSESATADMEAHTPDASTDRPAAARLAGSTLEDGAQGVPQRP